MSNKETLALATELENRRCNAIINGNIEELKELLSEDLFYGHAGGFYDGLNSFIDRLASGLVTYQVLATTVYQAIPLGENGISLNGEVVVEATINQVVHKLHCIYVGVWKLENKKWKFVAHQSARLPQPQ